MTKPKLGRDYHRLTQLLKLEPSAIVDTAEVAALLGYSRCSMPRVCRRTGFPTPLLAGGPKKWRLGDVQAWAGTLTSKTTPIPIKRRRRGVAPVTTSPSQAVQAARRAKEDEPFMFSVVKGAADASDPFFVIDHAWPMFTDLLAEPESRGHLARANYFAAVHSSKSTERAAARKLKDGDAWIPALFGPHQNERGNFRWSGNLLFVTALVLDVDNAQQTSTALTIEEALAAIPLPFCVAWHTTYSHTPDRPRFRVIVPWRSPVDTQTHERVFAAAQRRLSGRLDEVSRSPATLYYMPSCPPDARSDYLHGCRGDRLATPAELLALWESI